MKIIFKFYQRLSVTKNVKLVLKVVNELTIAAFKEQNELREPESRNNTHEFVDIPIKKEW